MSTVLLTRPLVQAKRTASTLAARGINTLISPLLEPVAKPFEMPRQKFDALLLTSATALRVIVDPDAIQALANLPVFAVGDTTAKAAREFGISQIHTPAPNQQNAMGLAQLVSQGFKSGNLLYLAGETRSADFAALLANPHIHLTICETYSMEEKPLSPDAAEALQAKAIKAVLHYSKNSAQSFLKQTQNIELGEINHICLSEQVAHAFDKVNCGKIHLAKTPNEKAIVELTSLICA